MPIDEQHMTAFTSSIRKTEIKVQWGFIVVDRAGFRTWHHNPHIATPVHEQFTNNVENIEGFLGTFDLVADERLRTTRCITCQNLMTPIDAAYLGIECRPCAGDPDLVLLDESDSAVGTLGPLFDEGAVADMALNPLTEMTSDELLRWGRETVEPNTEEQGAWAPAEHVAGWDPDEAAPQSDEEGGE